MPQSCRTGMGTAWDRSPGKSNGVPASQPTCCPWKPFTPTEPAQLSSLGSGNTLYRIWWAEGWNIISYHLCYGAGGGGRRYPCPLMRCRAGEMSPGAGQTPRRTLPSSPPASRLPQHHPQRPQGSVPTNSSLRCKATQQPLLHLQGKGHLSFPCSTSIDFENLRIISTKTQGKH